MRDTALVVIVLALIPIILRYPWIGALAYAWVSVFVPHRWAFGFANDMPIAMIIAVTTLASMLLHPKQVQLPINRITVLLMLLPIWMTVTLFFALEPDAAYERWAEVMKVFFFALVTASLVRSEKQVNALLWVLVLSVGFYSVKGGIFTILEEGAYKVYGPPGGSALADNGAIALASVMMIPLMIYLTGVVSSKWVKAGLLCAIPLSGMTVLGSQSRGAFLAVVAMMVFLWVKSRRKFIFGLVLVVSASLAIGFMPDKWTERMQTIQTYEKDASAMGRVNTWWMLFNLANDRPLVGGGFEPYTPRQFGRYAPDPLDVHAAHSIYFQVLGEHGYVGLILFLCLGIATWNMAGRLVKASRERSDCVRAGDLARAIQVSFVGFAVGGAFVNTAYWDLVYYEIVILMATYRLVQSPEPVGISILDRRPSVV
jgi:probable O-glycosylation ligase (exosortase A-associated)